MNDLQSYLSEKQTEQLETLKAFLRIPSISTDSARKEDIRQAANFLEQELSDLGFKTRLIETAQHPAVFAEYIVSKDLPTVLIYGHYDVQPADPLELWDSDPFEPTIKDGLIIARGASDDKGQVYAHVKGVEALLRTTGTLPVNVKFIIEGEEEIGSPNLDKLLEENQKDLAADIVLISDSSMIAPETPTITYGLKGLSYIEVKVTGAKLDLHSGAYRGGVPNPINILAKMIANLHDENSKISIPGFYDDVLELSEQEKDAFKAAPFNEQDFATETGLTKTPGEANYSLLERLWARPTLDANGIMGGYQGEGAKTVIPSWASAKISCRLVPNQTPEDITKKLSEHLKKLAPDSVTLDIQDHHGGMPALTPLNSQAIQLAATALEQTYNKATIFARTGGTIPVVSSFQQLLDADVVLVGLGLEDDRIHSPNEKFDLINYYKGIHASAMLLKAFTDYSS